MCVCLYKDKYTNNQKYNIYIYICIAKTSRLVAPRLVVTKIQAGIEQLSDRFASQRSRCDKRWESLFLEVSPGLERL